AATSPSSGFTWDGFPRYAGADDPVTRVPPSKTNVWSRLYDSYVKLSDPLFHSSVTLCSDMGSFSRECGQNHSGVQFRDSHHKKIKNITFFERTHLTFGNKIYRNFEQ